MKKPVGVLLLTVLFGYFAVYCLWAAVYNIVDFGIGSLLPGTNSVLPESYPITAIVIGVILIAFAVYFVRVAFLVFRVEESFKIKTIKDTLVLVLILSTAYIVAFYTVVRPEISHLSTWPSDRPIPIPWKAFVTVGATAVGLVYIIRIGRGYAKPEVDILQHEHSNSELA